MSPTTDANDKADEHHRSHPVKVTATWDVPVWLQVGCMTVVCVVLFVLARYFELLR